MYKYSTNYACFSVQDRSIIILTPITNDVSGDNHEEKCDAVAKMKTLNTRYKDDIILCINVKALLPLPLIYFKIH